MIVRRCQQGLRQVETLRALGIVFFRLFRVLASVHPRSGAYAVSVASSAYGFAPGKRAPARLLAMAELTASVHAPDGTRGERKPKDISRFFVKRLTFRQSCSTIYKLNNIYTATST